MTVAKQAPLLPAEDAREAALFFVVAALCFLAALSALAARSAYGAAKSWTTQVEGEMTIRLEGATPDDADAAAGKLAQLQGVQSIRVIKRDEAEDLLRPWFGEDIPPDLPLPVLLALETDPNAPGLAGRIRTVLQDEGLTARLDDHDVWATDLKRMLTALRVTALGAVGLLAAIALAVIAFATHAALLARRDVVDVLHLAGAQDGFIASLFERRFFGLGLRAGALGALFALGASALLVAVAKQSGGRDWLLPRMSLELTDGLILGLTPLVAGVAAMIAARVTVLRSLAATV